jgi:predicted PurR-regulated permease PerM
MPTELISTIVSSLGVVGALVWYMYHNTTTTIPNLTQQYTETQERLSEKFADTQEKITTNFAETLREEREYRKQEIQSLQQWIRNEAACKYNRDNPRDDLPG